MVWRDGQEAFRNPRAARLLGDRPEHAGLGGFVSTVSAGDQVAVLDHLRRAGGGAAPTPVVVQLDGDDGRWVELTASRLRTERGEATLVILRDVTDRRRLESTAAAQGRMATVGTLAAGVAHEINNPLSFLQLNLEMLAEQLPEVLGRPGASADQREAAIAELLSHVRDATVGVDRVRAVVHDLRTFSHAGDGEDEVVDLVDSVELAANLARHQVRHCATITLETPRPLQVRGSVGRFSQVVLNFVVNAAQAIDDAGIEGGHIRVVTGVRGDDAFIEVRDNGPGFPAALVERVFEPFFTTKRVGDGSGLGLSICRGIVDRAGGSIEALRPPAGGGCVRVTLPLAVMTTAPVEETGKPTLLLVEDEPLLLRALGSRLSADFDVRRASGGAEAVAMLDAGLAPDALLVDVMMPDMDGPSVFQWLATMRPELTERVVFMTGGAVTPGAVAFLRNTDTPVLEKPVDCGAIRDLLLERIASSGDAEAPTRERRRVPRRPPPPLRATLALGPEMHRVEVLDISRCGLRVAGFRVDRTALLTHPLTMHLVNQDTREHVALDVHFVRSRQDGERFELGLEVPAATPGGQAFERWAAA